MQLREARCRAASLRFFSSRGEKGNGIMPKKVAKKNAGASLVNTVAFRKILETGTWEFFLGHLPLAVGLRDDELFSAAASECRPG